MKFVVFTPPNDFRDESLNKVKLLLERWNVDFDVSSYSNKECVGFHGSKYMPDINTGKVRSVGYEGIILIDGKGIEKYELPEFRPLLDLIINFANDKKPICSIGNSTKILARANIIKNKKIAVNEKETQEIVSLFHGVPTEEEYEMSDNIITIKDSSGIEGGFHKFLEKIGVK